MPTIKINTGDVTYDIQNEFGEQIGVIRFNPSDPDILKRAAEIERWFNETTVDEDMTEEQFYQFTDGIKEQLDKFCNRPISEELFKVCNPMSIMADGSYYFANVIKVILDIVYTETKKRMKASEKRVKKAVAEIIGDNE